MVVHLVLASSSPPGQSAAPSHSMFVEMHVLSVQANWSGAQVTVTFKDISQFILFQRDTMLYNFTTLPLLGQISSSVPAGQSLCPSHTLFAGTHLSSGHWNSPGAHTHLKKNWTIVLIRKLKTIKFNLGKFWWHFNVVLHKIKKMQNIPPLITKVPTVIMSVAAVKVKNATSSRAEEFPFVTYHSTVCTNKSRPV